MGLATIDPHSQKEHTEIHKIPKFGVNRPVLTEIQAFKNVKNLQRNVICVCGRNILFCVNLKCHL